MATDATGTATSLGIPKYLTSADAPSGKGFNAAMDVINTLIGQRQKTTIGLFASGPPASPSDGDIWIAEVDHGDGTVWQFKYRAAAVSANKWEAIGGSPYQVLSTNLNVVVNTTLSAGGGWFYHAAMTWVPPRTGDYIVLGYVTLYSNGDGSVGDASINAMSNGLVLAGSGTSVTRESAADLNDSVVLPYHWPVSGSSVGGIGVVGTSPNNAVWKYGQVNFAVLPKRVS